MATRRTSCIFARIGFGASTWSNALSPSSCCGMTNQSSVTSDTGIGIYLRASIGTILFKEFLSTFGISRTDTKLAENGMEIPPVRAVTFASRMRSVSASAIFSGVSFTALPIATFPYGPKAISPYVSRIAVPRDARNCTIFADDAPISMPSILPSDFTPNAEENFCAMLPKENVILTQYTVFYIQYAATYSQCVYFCREDEIVFRKPFYRMRRKFHDHLAVRDVYVRVMAFPLGNGSDFFRKIHCLRKITEFELFDEPFSVFSERPAHYLL